MTSAEEPSPYSEYSVTFSLMESSLFSPSVVVTFLQFWFHVKILESELLIQDMRLAFYFYAINF